MTSFLSNLFDSMDKAKQPKQTPKDKLLDFEKMIRDDAKANGIQPRTHLENLCAQSETFANSKLVQMMLGEYQARQMKDPKTEVMVVKDGKVITIDKKDLAKYKADGYELAEAHGGKHTTTGRSMTKGEEDEKERLVKGMKKNKADFKKRYGKDADAVMYATATKNAMENNQPKFGKVLSISGTTVVIANPNEPGGKMTVDTEKADIKPAQDPNPTTDSDFVPHFIIQHKNRPGYEKQYPDNTFARYGASKPSRDLKVGDNVRIESESVQTEGALNVDRDTMSDAIGDMVETYVKRAPIEEINKILQFIKANKKVAPGKDEDRVIMTTEDGHTDTDSMQAKTAQIAKDAMALYKMFKNNPGDEEIMTWITNKLAVAADKISSVKDYLENPTRDDVTEYKRVEIKDKADYMAKRKHLQDLQMDPETNKNEKLKKEIIKRKADLEDEARKMGLKEDANTLNRLKDEVEDFMGEINNTEMGNLNPTRLADELTEILNGTYDPGTDPVNDPEANDEDHIRQQVANAIEVLEKGEIMPAMQMLNKAIGDDGHGVDFPNEDELTLTDDADFHETFGVLAYPTEEIWEAEYRGRKVKLNKPMRGDVKKFKVYVKDPKTGNIKKVNFGHGGTSAKRPTMRIRKNNPARRRSFRARHNCDNPGPKTKARYWSCRKW